MKRLSDEATFFLIYLVEEFPQLWSLQHDQYRKKDTKWKLWAGIAKEMQRHYLPYGPYTAEEVKRCFDNKRRIYRREKEKTTKTKSGQCAEDAYDGTWRFYSSLHFVDRSRPVLSRACTEICQEKGPYALESDTELESAVAATTPACVNTPPAHTKCASTVSSVAPSGPPVKRPKREEKKGDECSATGWKQRTAALAQIAESFAAKDTDDMAGNFGKVVADHMRTLDEKRFIRCQTEVLQLIERHLDHPLD